MNDNEYSTVNNKYYVNPETSLNEQNQFVDKLREAQQTENDRIATTTHALGSDLPSRMGGLTGAEATFTSRYQTPYVDKMVADLKSTAQAKALSDTMSNLLAQKQQEYNDAYRAAYKKKEKEAKAAQAAAAAQQQNYVTGNVTTETPQNNNTGQSYLTNTTPGTTMIVEPDGRIHVYDNENMDGGSVQFYQRPQIDPNKDPFEKTRQLFAAGREYFGL